jgi:peptidoglycan/LPS O-acetylase OafA/YrhL
LLAALLSFSNFFFWTQEGYFGSKSIRPLLHTWSLGVEEQFYIFFPLLLYGLFRWFPQRLRVMLWSLIALSFLSACLVMRFNPTTAFFWSPLRAWELLAGVMISQYNFAALKLRWLRESASLMGLALIVFAGSFYTSETAFPGWTAAVPCLGAVCIIAAGQVGTSRTAGLLALPPLRFIGLISYSLYLCHWPLLVFQNTSMILSSRPIGLRSTKFLVLAVSILVATMSWLLVETPFRRGRFKPAKHSLFAMTAAAAILIVGFSLWVLLGKGLASRFSQDVQRLAEFDAPNVDLAWRAGDCFVQAGETFQFKPKKCLDRVAGRKTYLLYGDSEAAALYEGLVETFPEIHFQQATASACPPYQDFTETGVLQRDNCVAMWQFINDRYLKEQRPDAVILSATWYKPNFERLGQEIDAFHQRGIPVILTGPAIAFDTPLPPLIATEMQRHQSPATGGRRISAHQIPEFKAVDGQMAELARDRWRVRYISIFKELCQRQAEQTWQTPDGCPLLLPGGEPLLMDHIHLTPSGSELFGRRVRADGLLP